MFCVKQVMALEKSWRASSKNPLLVRDVSRAPGYFPSFRDVPVVPRSFPCLRDVSRGSGTFPVVPERFPSFRDTSRLADSAVPSGRRDGYDAPESAWAGGLRRPLTAVDGEMGEVGAGR